MKEAHDFRSEAVQVSKQILAAKRIRLDEPDLTKAQMSVCVPAAGDPQALRRTVIVRLLLLLVLGFSGLIAGAVIAKFVVKLDDAGSKQISPMLIVAVCCTICGIASMCSAVWVQKQTVRRYLERVGAIRPTLSPAELIFVSIEDAQSYQKPKLVPEDVAALHLDSERRMISAEGFSHRYVVCAQDVLAAKLANTRGSQGVRLDIAIGGTDTVLSLVIEYSSLKMNLKRTLLPASRTRLASVFEKTMGITVERAGRGFAF